MIRNESRKASLDRAYRHLLSSISEMLRLEDIGVAGFDVEKMKSYFATLPLPSPEDSPETIRAKRRAVHEIVTNDQMRFHLAKLKNASLNPEYRLIYELAEQIHIRLSSTDFAFHAQVDQSNSNE